jgi:hypothetical protein
VNYPIVTDVIRRVQNKEGKCLDVRPWPEGPSFVTLTNEGDEQSQEYFGALDITLEPEFARHLGRALIACADEIEPVK